MKRKLRSLQQANQDFSTYNIEFIWYTVDIQWNQIAKKLQLEEGLQYDLKNDLIARNQPKLVADFITFLQKLNQKRHPLTISVQGGKTAPPAQVASYTQYIHLYIEHTYLYTLHIYIYIATKSRMSTITVSGFHARLMNLFRGRKKLTLGGRACCLAKGYCLYYSSIDHVAHNY